MEILRMFINLLKNLFDLLLVFFALQNFLPRRPLPHLTEFEHVINKHPAQYQYRNVHEVALYSPSKSFYHFPWRCLVLVHQRRIHHNEAFRSSSHQFFQCVLAVNNGLGRLSVKVERRVREGHTFPSAMRTLTKAIGVLKGVPAVNLSAFWRSNSTPRQAILRLFFSAEFWLRLSPMGRS